MVQISGMYPFIFLFLECVRWYKATFNKKLKIPDDFLASVVALINSVELFHPVTLKINLLRF